MKKRLPYIIALILIIAVEVLIALFVNDSFVRPYIGDVIVVWAVYAFVQSILGGKFNSFAVSAGVFLFACFVEALQGINIVELLGLGESPFFRTLIGTHFDPADILCYAAGTAILMIFILIFKRTASHKST